VGTVTTLLDEKFNPFQNFCQMIKIGGVERIKRLAEIEKR